MKKILLSSIMAFSLSNYLFASNLNLLDGIRYSFDGTNISLNLGNFINLDCDLSQSENEYSEKVSNIDGICDYVNKEVEQAKGLSDLSVNAMGCSLFVKTNVDCAKNKINQICQNGSNEISNLKNKLVALEDNSFLYGNYLYADDIDNYNRRNIENRIFKDINITQNEREALLKKYLNKKSSIYLSYTDEAIENNKAFEEYKQKRSFNPHEDYRKISFFDGQKSLVKDCKAVMDEDGNVCELMKVLFVFDKKSDFDELKTKVSNDFLKNPYQNFSYGDAQNQISYIHKGLLGCLSQEEQVKCEMEKFKNEIRIDKDYNEMKKNLSIYLASLLNLFDEASRTQYQINFYGGEIYKSFPPFVREKITLPNIKQQSMSLLVKKYVKDTKKYILNDFRNTYEKNKNLALIYPNKDYAREYRNLLYQLPEPQ